MRSLGVLPVHLVKKTDQLQLQTLLAFGLKSGATSHTQTHTQGHGDSRVIWPEIGRLSSDPAYADIVTV